MTKNYEKAALLFIETTLDNEGNPDDGIIGFDNSETFKTKVQSMNHTLGTLLSIEKRWRRIAEGCGPEKAKVERDEGINHLPVVRLSIKEGDKWYLREVYVVE